MQFNPDFKPHRDGFPESLAAKADELFYTRRTHGLNVQFIRQDGDLDEMSFADMASRDAHITKMKRLGTEHVVSA